MAKKKDSMALFEVISNQKAKPAGPNVSVPGWMGKADELADAPPVEQARPQPPAPAPKPPRPKPAPEPPSPIRFAAPAKPAMAVESGRLKFSLDHVSGSLVAAGALVLLLVAFGLGRWTAPQQGEPVAEAPDETPQEAGKSPARKAGTPGKPAPAPKPPLLESGRYYLVVQTLRGTTPAELKDARQIEKFCNDNALSATVVTYTPRGRTPRYMVWSRKPFRLAETLGPQAGKHAEQVEKLGKQYNSTYRGYNFKQARNPRGQVEGWFLKYEKKK